MNSQPNPQQKEDKALQALITATLHVRGDDVRLEEIEHYLKPGIELSSEDERAIKRLGADPFASVVADSSKAAAVTQESFVMALNRKNKDSDFETKTTEELNRKRRELLEKLRKRQTSK